MLNHGDPIVHATVPLREDDTVRHVIDASQSRLFVQVFATGLLSAFAHSPRIAVPDFQGNVDFPAGDSPVAGARLSIRFRADSLEVADDMSDRDRSEIHRRMSEEVLAAEQFPEIIYECSRVSASGGGERYWVALNGELTLRGVTRNVPVTAIVVLNGNSLRATGEFTLRQSDFGIAPVTAAAGTIRLKDGMKGSFDILAHRQ